MGKMVEVTLEIDSELKEQAEKVCMENSLTLEEAFVLFAEETVRLGRFPFELDGFTSDIFRDTNFNHEKLKRGLEQVRAGLGITKTIEELEEMEKDGS